MLSIPRHIWDEMLEALASTPQGLERVAYIDGYRFRDEKGVTQCIATTLTIPDAELRPYNYNVRSEAMSQAGMHLFAYEMVRLAQIHTHGNENINHSPTDDARAYSQLDGALSFVLPHHAINRPDLSEAAIHVRQPEGWIRLSSQVATQLVRIVPSRLDHRKGARASKSRKLFVKREGRNERRTR